MSNGVIVEIGTNDELMSKKGNYFSLVEAQQIQQTQKDKESLENSSGKLLTTRKEDIVPEEDYAIGNVVTKSASSSISARRKSDLESGMKFDYEFTR